MRRSRATLAEVADLATLARAFWRAARGKRTCPEVIDFADHLDRRLAELGRSILDGTVEVGEMRSFEIRDPKQRTIHAPCFRERVLHHALIEKIGPPLDLALVDDSFACRAGKGTLAAVLRAQRHIRRFPWYLKIDVRAYFASVDHEVLRAALRRKLRDRGVLRLCDRIIASHAASPGRGLPIGALTSQHFANYYLAPLDRLILEGLRAPAMVRYMDDVVVWCHSGAEARALLRALDAFTADALRLTLKPAQIQRSERGVSFLGFRVLPGALRLSRRRRRRYAAARRRLERDRATGAIDAAALQAGIDAALAITAHADARGWRRAELRRRPAMDA